MYLGTRGLRGWLHRRGRLPPMVQQRSPGLGPGHAAQERQHQVAYWTGLSECLISAPMASCCHFWQRALCSCGRPAGALAAAGLHSSRQAHLLWSKMSPSACQACCCAGPPKGLLGSGSLHAPSRLSAAQPLGPAVSVVMPTCVQQLHAPGCCQPAGRQKPPLCAADLLGACLALIGWLGWPSKAKGRPLGGEAGSERCRRW